MTMPRAESDRRELCEQLLMRNVDGCISPEEREQLATLLEEFPEYREELDDYVAIKRTTDAMTQRILQQANIELPLRFGEKGRAGRMVIGAGCGLIVAGYLLMTGFALYHVLSAPDLPMAHRIGIGAVLTGTALLLGYVIRLRIRTSGNDAYEEIDR